MPRPLALATLSLLAFVCLPAVAQGAQEGLPPPTLTALLAPAALRPTYRATQAKGRQDKQRKMPVIATKPPREFRDVLNGLRVEYPEDWIIDFSVPEQSVAVARYDWTYFGSTAPQYHSTFLAVGVLDLKRPVTPADLTKDYADATREPKYAEQFQDPRFLIMYEPVSSTKSTWKNRETLESTFTHRWKSKDRKVRQIRIPAGNRIITLEYSALTEWFDRDLHFFEDFRKSFGLL